MLFIITPMRGHIQNGCTIARYWTSIKLNYSEIEFVPRAQESWAGLLHSLPSPQPGLHRWEQVSNGNSTATSGNWAIAPCSSFPFQRLGSHPSPGELGLSVDERALSVDKLSRFCLWTKKRHLERWDSPFSLFDFLHKGWKWLKNVLKRAQILWSSAVEQRVVQKRTHGVSALKKVIRKRCSRYINAKQLLFHLFHANVYHLLLLIFIVVSCSRSRGCGQFPKRL